LYPIKRRWVGEDKFCWGTSKRGLFDVRSFFSILGCKEALFSIRIVFGKQRLL
jgi:hypothetical protein